jgi:hypothetical protein
VALEGADRASDAVAMMVDRQRSAAARLRSRARLVVQGVVSLVLVVVIFRYLLGGIDLAGVWAEIAAMTHLELAGLLAIVAWNLATYALVPVTVGLSFWRIMMVSRRPRPWPTPCRRSGRRSGPG